MFWRVTSLAQSPVEAILDRGDFTLADLLDEDDVIQEARALNGRLVSFLSKRETVRQLVDYIVEPPPAGAYFGEEREHSEFDGARFRVQERGVFFPRRMEIDSRF